MEYDKRQFTKANDKKVLHKVRKQWVTVSLSLLAALGFKALATTNANADTTKTSTQTANASQTNSSQAKSNVKLVNPQSNVKNNQTGGSTSMNRSAQGRQAQTMNSSASSEQIMKQANGMHRNMIIGAMHQPNDQATATATKPYQLLSTAQQNDQKNSGNTQGTNMSNATPVKNNNSDNSNKKKGKIVFYFQNQNGQRVGKPYVYTNNVGSYITLHDLRQQMALPLGYGLQQYYSSDHSSDTTYYVKNDPYSKTLYVQGKTIKPATIKITFDNKLNNGTSDKPFITYPVSGAVGDIVVHPNQFLNNASDAMYFNYPTYDNNGNVNGRTTQKSFHLVPSDNDLNITINSDNQPIPSQYTFTYKEDGPTQVAPSDMSSVTTRYYDRYNYNTKSDTMTPSDNDKKEVPLPDNYDNISGGDDNPSQNKPLLNTYKTDFWYTKQPFNHLARTHDIPYSYYWVKNLNMVSHFPSNHDGKSFFDVLVAKDARIFYIDPSDKDPNGISLTPSDPNNKAHIVGNPQWVTNIKPGDKINMVYHIPDGYTLTTEPGAKQDVRPEDDYGYQNGPLQKGKVTQKKGGNYSDQINNGVNYFVALKRIHPQATVVYYQYDYKDPNDSDNKDKVISQNDISGPYGSNFSVDGFDKANQLSPGWAKYKWVLENPERDSHRLVTFDTENQTVKIPLETVNNPNPKPSDNNKPIGSTKIIYQVPSDSYKQVGNQTLIEAPVGDNMYPHYSDATIPANIPAGYIYHNLSNGKINGKVTPRLVNGSTNVIYVDRPTANIIYRDSDGHPIKSDHITQDPSTPINYDNYTQPSDLPSGYMYAQPTVDPKDDKTIQNGHNEYINLKEVKGTIYVHYVYNGNTLPNNVGHFKGEVGTTFNVLNYGKNHVPSGYQYAGLNNSPVIAKFNDETQNFYVNLKLPSDSTMVEYEDPKPSDNVSGVIDSVLVSGQKGQKIPYSQYEADIPTSYNGTPMSFTYVGLAPGDQGTYQNGQHDIVYVNLNKSTPSSSAAPQPNPAPNPLPNFNPTPQSSVTPPSSSQPASSSSVSQPSSSSVAPSPSSVSSAPSSSAKRPSRRVTKPTQKHMTMHRDVNHSNNNGKIGVTYEDADGNVITKRNYQGKVGQSFAPTAPSGYHYVVVKGQDVNRFKDHRQHVVLKLVKSEYYGISHKATHRASASSANHRGYPNRNGRINRDLKMYSGSNRASFDHALNQEANIAQNQSNGQKLPQTGESSVNVSAVGMILLMISSIMIAGYDFDAKRQRN